MVVPGELVQHQTAALAHAAGVLPSIPNHPEPSPIHPDPSRSINRSQGHAIARTRIAMRNVAMTATPDTGRLIRWVLQGVALG